jgi:hypothetical protein
VGLPNLFFPFFMPPLGKNNRVGGHLNVGILFFLRLDSPFSFLLYNFFCKSIIATIASNGLFFHPWGKCGEKQIES